MKFKARARPSNYHPLLWWIWAALTTVVLFLQNNRWASVAIVTATLFIVYWNRNSRYWFQTMRWAIRFALIAFTLRMAIGFLIGVPMPGTILFSLPQIELPEFLVGIRIGGDVTSQRLLSALDEALLLVALILVFAGANALSNPHNLLRVLPKKFYGIGLASVIASSVAPQAARSITRVRNAKRLRGQPSTGIKSWRSVALPVLEDSLECSIDLAASLESRGYGYFDKPTKYRPEKWGRREMLALSGPLYAILVIVNLNLPPIWLALVLLFSISTPVMAS